MNSLKVLISGASGFIGLPLVEKLSESGCEVMALSRTCIETKTTSTVQWLKADLSLPESYREEVKAFSPEIVVHLSWQDIPDFSFDTSIMNLNQSLEFLAFVLEIESCNKILISGSCLEYNKAQGECKESDVCSPKDHFTWAKNSIYSWLSMRCAQKEVVLGWFRIFYVYGPGQRPGSLVPTILSSLKNNELPYLRTPKNANDYIFIDDVIDAFYAAIISEKISSGIYNLGSGTSTTVLDICRYAEQIILGTDLHTQQLERETKNSTADTNFWAGINATKKKLDWSPKIALESGIKRTCNDFNKL